MTPMKPKRPQQKCSHVASIFAILTQFMLRTQFLAEWQLYANTRAYIVVMPHEWYICSLLSRYKTSMSIEQVETKNSEYKITLIYGFDYTTARKISRFFLFVVLSISSSDQIRVDEFGKGSIRYRFCLKLKCCARYRDAINSNDIRGHQFEWHRMTYMYKLSSIAFCWNENE